jgi:hypothetical protein
MDKPDFVGHQKFSLDEASLGDLASIQNFIVEPKSPEDAWIKDTSFKIGDWRANFRSTYFRWALAINGLEVASKHYQSRSREQTGFTIASLRSHGVEQIALWDFATAAKNHRDTMPMLAAWGVADLYSGMEEFVFQFYKLYLSQHPDSLLRGDEFQHLRRLRRNASQGVEHQCAWEAAWTERLANWQKKRLYDGLNKVFLSYTEVVGLKTPSIHRLTTVETWADTIKGIGELRNCFAHGVTTVSKELAEFSQKPHSMLFDFAEGEPLTIELRHLQSVECFLDQLLTALNLSLIERAGYKLPARVGRISEA